MSDDEKKPVIKRYRVKQQIFLNPAGDDEPDVIVEMEASRGAIAVGNGNLEEIEEIKAKPEPVAKQAAKQTEKPEATKAQSKKG